MNDSQNALRRWIFPVVAAIGLLAVSARAAGPLPRGTLSGKIVDVAGKPVVGARVWIDRYDAETSAMKVVSEARTAADGSFRLGPLEPTYRSRVGLMIDADGFAFTSMLDDRLTVYAGSDCDLGAITLDRGRVYTGQVLDVDGRPRANATVRVILHRDILGHTVRRVGSEQLLKTDIEGRFRTRHLPVGCLVVHVEVPARQLAAVVRLTQPGGQEDLGEIHLEKDVPVSGTVIDEDGNPIAGVEIGGTFGHEATTDEEGRFTLRGFGPNPSFQMNVRKFGYVRLVGIVKGTEAGLRYYVRSNKKQPARELIVPLKRAGWIEGQAIDAETGEPVRLEKVVVCNFTRKPNGDVVLNGCQADFEQIKPGHFRAPYPAPDEYHLTFSAAGYHDAEAFTPKVTELKTIEGIVAWLKRKTEGSTAAIATQTITGRVTRDGRTVGVGWVGLWALGRPRNVINAPVLRGRTVAGPPIVYASAPIRDGSYTLDVPFQSDNWYAVVEEPGKALTQVGPIAFALKEQKTLDISCREGGRIRGRIKGVPPAWEGHVWVVAFSKSAVQAESRVEPNGEFSLPTLPPGEYGLKVGHDAYEDAEVYPGMEYRKHPEAFKEMADPWKRAKVVKVDAGQGTDGVELEMPQ